MTWTLVLQIALLWFLLAVPTALLLALLIGMRQAGPVRSKPPTLEEVAHQWKEQDKQ